MQQPPVSFSNSSKLPILAPSFVAGYEKMPDYESYIIQFLRSIACPEQQQQQQQQPQQQPQT